MKSHVRSCRGAALVDILAACAVMAIVTAIAVPTLHAARDRDEARMASRFLALRLQTLRAQALRRNQMIAMRFDPLDPARLTVYADGDGDGVLQRDVDAGVDPLVAPGVRLTDYFTGVSLAIPRDVPAPEGGALLAAGSDPVRIGATNLLSFSPLGSATAGTIYLASRSGLQMCIRIFGATGRVRVLWFDTSSGTWRQD